MKEDFSNFFKGYKFMLKPICVILAVVIIVLIILSGALYYIMLNDGIQNNNDPKNGPAAVAQYINTSTINDDGSITLDKTAEELWNELQKSRNRLTQYLNSPEELLKLMNAEMATTLLDTRPGKGDKEYDEKDWQKNIEMPIDWAKLNKQTNSKNVQGTIKLKRSLDNGNTITMTYVTPGELQGYIDEYNETGSEDAKDAAMSHFTLEKQLGAAGGLYSNGQFPTYNLTEDQIRDIAKSCAAEMGNNDWRGMCAQATSLVNIYEIKRYQKVEDALNLDLYNYIRYGRKYNTSSARCFSKADALMAKPNGSESNPVNDLAIEAVKFVIVTGHRTMPAYINEHDWINDIKYTQNDGVTFDKKNYSQYISKKTLIRGLGSNYFWTFFMFPSGLDVAQKALKDPYGYNSTAEKYKNAMGISDAYYDSPEPGVFTLVNGSVTGLENSTASNTSIANILATSTKASNASQIVTVIGPTSGKNYTVTLWDKKTGNWVQSISTTEGAVGKNGLTDSSSKREGDGKTPKGFYDILSSFGRDSNPGTKLAYRQIKEDSYWTQKTNRWTNIKDNLGGTEYLWEYRNGAYKYAMVIGYNYDEYVDGKGSAIFLHCKTGDSTAGCISVPENIMLEYMKNIGNNAYIAIASDEKELASILGSNTNVSTSNTNNTQTSTSNSTQTNYTGSLSNPMNTGQRIVAEANKYVGNPYIFGGNSLTNGIDCSHFVWQILKICGVYNGGYRRSTNWISVGEPVADLSQALPGDIVVWDGHVAIYDGNGLLVEALGRKWGITNDRDAQKAISGGNHQFLGIRRFTNDTGPWSGAYASSTQNSTYIAKIATWSKHTDIQSNEVDRHRTSDLKYINITDDDKEFYDKEVTYTMSAQPVAFQNYVSKYSMPFNYLWAMLLIGKDKNFVFDLANLVYNSEFEITVHDNLNITKTTDIQRYTKKTEIRSKATIRAYAADDDSGKILETIKPYQEGPFKGYKFRSYIKTHIVIDEVNTMEISLTKAHAWCVNYDKDYEYNELEVTSTSDTGLQDIEDDIYEGDAKSGKDALDKQNSLIEAAKQKYPNYLVAIKWDTKFTYSVVERKQQTQFESKSSKYVSGPSRIEEKTDKNAPEDSPNFVSLLSKNYNAKSNILSVESWLFKILEGNENTKDKVDLTKYLLYKLTGQSYGITTFDFSVFDPANFMINTNGLMNGSLEDKIWCALKNGGVSDVAAAAAMGNFSLESGGNGTNTIKPNTVEKGSGEGIGFVQWSFGRKEKLISYAQSKNLTWQDENTQIEFMTGELFRTGPAKQYTSDQFMTKTYRGTTYQATAWKNIPDDESQLEFAVKAFCATFERPRDEAFNEENMIKRINPAKYFYSKYKGKTAADFGNASGGTGWTTKGVVNYPIYLQYDERWGNNAYNYGVGKTISSGGCGACALAMAVSGLKGQNITPDIIVNKLNAKKYNTVNGSADQCSKYIAQEYGITYSRLSKSDEASIKQALQSGKCIMLSTGKNGVYTNSGGHYILCYATDGNGYYVIDSGNYYNKDTLYTYNQVFGNVRAGLFTFGR